MASHLDNLISILYFKNSKCQVPLKSISYSIEIVDSLSFISLIQIYENTNPTPIETEYFFSTSNEACFYEFSLKINEKTIKGLIKEKEEAKEEYQNALKRGLTAGFSQLNSKLKDIVQVNVGNIPPKTEVQIKFSFLQKLDISLNKFWKLQIPGTFTPRYNSEYLYKKGDEFLMKKSEKLVNIFGNYTWDIKISIKSSSEITFIKSPSHSIDIDFDNSKCNCSIKFKEKEIPDKAFILLYRNELINQPHHSLEYLENDKEYPYCALLSVIPDFNSDATDLSYAKYQEKPSENQFDVSILESKAEFIIILDRSGSMSGSRIDMAKASLIFFLKSIPPDSYFNIYSFGDTFDALSKDSLIANEKNINWAISKINKFEANYGGTHIYEPLFDVYKQNSQNKYPKTIFLMTDGAVVDADRIISLISRKSDLCRVYSLGIGNDCSSHLIIESATAGKGKYEFITNLKDMNEKVIFLLQDAISPFYTDVKIEYDKEIVELMSPLPKIIRKNEIFNVFFFFNKSFSDKKVTKFVLNYYDSLKNKDEKKEITLKADDLMITNNFFHKYAAFLTLKQMSTNFSNKLDIKNDIYLAEKMNLEGFSLDLSLKYQILSYMTAFICIIEEDKEEKEDKPFKKLEKIIVPNHISIDYQQLDDYARNPPIILRNQNYATKSAGCCGGSDYTSSPQNYSNYNENSYEKPDNQANASRELLLTIFQAQKVEGFWKYDESLIDKLKINRNILADLLLKFKGKEDDLMTILILYYLEKKQNEKKGTWVLIFNKGKEWLKVKSGMQYPKDFVGILNEKSINELFL